MKVKEIFENKGEQVMMFIDYLDTRFPGKEEKKKVLADFAKHLFKDGWQFSCGASICNFMKGTNASGKFMVVVPQRWWAISKFSTLNLFFFTDYINEHGDMVSADARTNILISSADEMKAELEDFMEDPKNG